MKKLIMIFTLILMLNIIISSVSFADDLDIVTSTEVTRQVSIMDKLATNLRDIYKNKFFNPVLMEEYLYY